MNTETLTRDIVRDYAVSIATDIQDLVALDNWQDWDDVRDDEGNALSIGAWIEDSLDIEYRVSVDKVYRSAKVLISLGGPNTWIDTATQSVDVFWGTGASTYVLPEEFCEQLDTMLSEYWSAR